MTPYTVTSEGRELKIVGPHVQTKTYPPDYRERLQEMADMLNAAHAVGFLAGVTTAREER